MDLLRKELERKRKAVQLAKQSSDVRRIEIKNSKSDNKKNDNGKCNKGSGGDDGVVKKSYLRTVDMRRFQEKQEEEELIQQNKKESHRRLDNISRKRQRDEEKAESSVSTTKSGRSSNLKEEGTKSKRKDGQGDGSTDSETVQNKHTISSSDKKTLNDDNVDEKEKQMTTDEITNALRELGIPVWLFGEINDSQRRERLRDAYENQKTKLAGISEMDEYRLGSGHGIRNPFLGSKKGQQNDDDDAMKQSNVAKKSRKEGDGAKDSKNKTTEEGIYNIDEHADDPHKTIHKFFKSLLRQWEDDLAHRPESIKRTAAGKNETKTLKQCKDYIRPLFKLCKSRLLEESMMNHILKIVKFCDEGEFVKAHDAYIDVAIGRAAWPIGVTMVGIHARSGRAKIASSNVAHVMNSELQRKYLTSVKRLMSYYQKKRQDVAPSKKVMNL